MQTQARKSDNTSLPLKMQRTGEAFIKIPPFVLQACCGSSCAEIRLAWGVFGDMPQKFVAPQGAEGSA
jgi:hypothetical protein